MLTGCVLGEKSARRVVLIGAAKSGAVTNVEGVAVAAVIGITLLGFSLYVGLISSCLLEKRFYRRRVSA